MDVELRFLSVMIGIFGVGVIDALFEHSTITNRIFADVSAIFIAACLVIICYQAAKRIENKEWDSICK